MARPSPRLAARAIVRGLEQAKRRPSRARLCRLGDNEHRRRGRRGGGVSRPAEVRVLVEFGLEREPAQGWKRGGPRVWARGGKGRGTCDGARMRVSLVRGASMAHQDSAHIGRMTASAAAATATSSPLSPASPSTMYTPAGSRRLRRAWKARNCATAASTAW